ncbi:hypothetical protein [Streptomyces sp. Ru72]|uniref:hypothetical protein n=1 Tax=Streptomyces sp. Ru72 TaxID=2080747 RepID=UPI000CDD8191|nr:hypothetical protein [Streptomyces sp. Ru72]POX45228.1 hypothetical protein C3488_30275 [Streptomyces sp. Ru72]
MDPLEQRVHRDRRRPTAEAFADELDRLAGPSSAPAPRRPRRRRGGAVLALAAVAVAGAAGTATTLLLRHTAAANVTVQDSTGRLRAAVPAAGADSCATPAGTPGELGLPAVQEPALAVADDLSRWQDLSTSVNGAFIGLSEHGDPSAKVRALDHAGCRYEGSRDYRGTVWQGRIRTWNDCDGGKGSVTEAALAPADGADGPRVYVQLRQDGGSDRTDRILDSVRVTG